MTQLKNLAAPFFLSLILVIVVIAGLLGLAVDPTHADGPDEAHVVLVFPGEQGTVRPISFTTSISKVGALRLAGWNVEANDNAVCSIEGIGCPASDCFCADNWWSSAGWDLATNSWDTMSWPPPDVFKGGIAGFRWSKTAWGAPLLPGPVYTAASGALEWLQLQQSASDGGYGNNSGSVEMLLALGANQLKAGEWRRQANSPSLLNYVLRNGPTFANSNVAASGKLAVGLTAVGGCWPPGAKQPLDYSAEGAFSSGSGWQAWAILGTHALSQPIPAQAIQNLRSQQILPSGGWEWSPAWGTDTNSTALAIQALLAAGEPVSSSAIMNGLNYLDNSQNSDGGFPFDRNSAIDTTSDTNSTAYVVQALLAAGEVPTSTRWTTGSGATPLSYLLDRQLADGSFEFKTDQGKSDPIATRQVVLALLGKPLPLEQRELHPCTEQEIGLYNIYLPLVVKN